MLSGWAKGCDGSAASRSLARPPLHALVAALMLSLGGCLPSAFDELTKDEQGANDACDNRAFDASNCPRDAQAEEAGNDAANDAASADAMSADASEGEGGASEAGMVDGSPPAMCSGECEAGAEETDMPACGACGTGKQTRKRTCSVESCTWSEWVNVGACAGVTAACEEGDTSPCDNADSCGQRVCNAECKWSACQPKKANGCLRIRKGSMLEGSNYRCCETGHWQFCMPDCSWSTECKPCTEDAPNFCSDCYP